MTPGRKKGGNDREADHSDQLHPTRRQHQTAGQSDGHGAGAISGEGEGDILRSGR